MREETTVALVTGANRGIGEAFVTALLGRGAKRVYAAARRSGDAAEAAKRDPKRIVPIELDVTDAAQVARATETAGDVTLLINNAGVVNFGGAVSAPDLSGARDEMEVNYFAALSMCRAFAPVLKQNGGGAIVGVVSVLGLAAAPVAATYSASKAALSSMLQSLRLELAAQGTVVAAVYPGPVRTRMIKPIEDAMQDVMVTPDVIANAALDGLRAGETDIFPGTARDVLVGLRADLKVAWA